MISSRSQRLPSVSFCLVQLRDEVARLKNGRNIYINADLTKTPYAFSKKNGFNRGFREKKRCISNSSR